MIEGMRAKATRERVIQRLYEMALARANDAVKLAYCQEPTEDEIRRLDLGAVAEFRRSNLGSVEIRFIDRVKALQALAGMLEGEGCEAEEFSARWCRRRRKREGDDTALAAAEEGVRLVGEEGIRGLCGDHL